MSNNSHSPPHVIVKRRAVEYFCIGCLRDLTAKPATVSTFGGRGTGEALRAPSRLSVSLQAGGGPWDTGTNSKARADFAVCEKCLGEVTDALDDMDGHTGATPRRATNARRHAYAIARVLSVISAAILEREGNGR